MIDRILEQELFKQQPPVLVDIGASGGIYKGWQHISRYAIGVAFDADDREMKVTESSASGFLKLITLNRIVTDRMETEIDFYLTASPFCSSALEPDREALAAWPFQELFTVQKKVMLKAVRLVDALGECGITYVDWLKIDTQGTDLRIFKSLPEAIRQNTLAVEFEPGILEAYKGEDKLWAVMEFMREDFFLSSMNVKGVPRLSSTASSSLSPIKRRAVATAHRSAPGWAELGYLNLLRSRPFPSRAFQLQFVFALVQKQYGFAAEVARLGLKQTGDEFFKELEAYAVRKMKTLAYAWPFIGARNRVGRWMDRLFA